MPETMFLDACQIIYECPKDFYGWSKKQMRVNFPWTCQGWDYVRLLNRKEMYLFFYWKRAYKIRIKQYFIFGKIPISIEDNSSSQTRYGEIYFVSVH